MRAFAIVMALLAWSRAASAHQTSVKYVDLASHDSTLDVTVKVAPGDVTEPMGLPPDATPSVDAAVASASVPSFVHGWLALPGCRPVAPPASKRVDAGFLAVTWSETCMTPKQVDLDFTAFFALDRRHEAIVRLSRPGYRSVQTIVRATAPRITMRPGETPSLLAWVHTGMDHIYSGIDHILFVISLLLVVMLKRERGAAGATWHLRAPLPTLRSTGLVITAFTIAHSTTLIAASLGVVSLPSRFVESMIALSIAYTAAEDVVNPAVRWRFVLTFGFGLVHGLGFAATLSQLLPPTDVVVPLLCFNVGVEIGQLSIVLVVLPLLFLLARGLGAERYRRIVLPSLAAPIVLLGILMVIDRM